MKRLSYSWPDNVRAELVKLGLCAMLLCMSSNTLAAQATLNDLHFMVGAWRGALGPQTVEEAWSEPSGGTMSTMVRLNNPDSTFMVELIVIRETGDGLILHLRQFSPALELRLAQDMPLAALTSNSVRFEAPAGSAIKALGYRDTGPETMEVDVTLADDTVVTAQLQRH